MRVLIVTNVATKGSIGSILSILKDGLLNNGHEVKICYGYYNDKPQDSVYRRVCTKIEFIVAAFLTRLTGFEGFYNCFSYKRLVKAIESFKPDVIQLANLHAYYINEYSLLDYLKASNIPTVYSMFDAYAFTGKCPFPVDCIKYNKGCGNCKQIKQYPKSLFFDRSHYLYEKKREAYNGFRNLHFVGGVGIYYIAKESTLLSDKNLHLIDEPQQLDNIFYPRDTSKLKQKLGIHKDDKVVLAAVPLKSFPERKRGYYFLDLCKKMKGIPGYSFIYIGFDTDQFGEPDNLIKVPYLESADEFASYLSLGDILFFTSVADTTPCTVIDALACGTPVVGFNIEGMNCFHISDTNVLNAVEIGDIDKIMDIVMKAPKKNDALIKACRDSVYYQFESKYIVQKYIELYKGICGHE